MEQYEILIGMLVNVSGLIRPGRLMRRIKHWIGSIEKLLGHELDHSAFHVYKDLMASKRVISYQLESLSVNELDGKLIAV